MTKRGAFMPDRGNYTPPGGIRTKMPPIVLDAPPPKVASCNLTLHSKKCREQHTMSACTRDAESCIGTKQ